MYINFSCQVSVPKRAIAEDCDSSFFPTNVVPPADPHHRTAVKLIL
uniref:Uncharacterized protein n=1 Tax=Arundo donax TaxID=35708 RepID=A0A0A9EJI0_ARUDO